MTTIPARLGARQVAVLRAAAAGELIRYDDGGWAARSTSYTQPARSVAALEPALLAEGKRGAEVTGGSWKTRPGTWMVLTAAGQAALDAWDAQHPQEVIAMQRRAAVIRVLAGLPGDELMAGVLAVGSHDELVDDDAFPMLARVVDGDPILDDDEWD